MVVSFLLHILQYEEKWYFLYKPQWVGGQRGTYEKIGVTFLALLLYSKALTSHLNVSLLTIFSDKSKGQELLSHVLKHLDCSIAHDPPHWMLGGPVCYTSSYTLFPLVSFRLNIHFTNAQFKPIKKNNVRTKLDINGLTCLFCCLSSPVLDLVCLVESSQSEKKKFI